ncbi:MAG: group II intron reverse transcriptase/maturase [Verrucomicrobiota bacterium]
MSETQRMENQSQSNEELTVERMLEKEHLLAAYKAVKAKAGAPGIDGMTVEALGPHLQEHWPQIAAKLREGRYRPSAVRAVDIPKPQGGVRTLGIPTVLDRLVQQAILQLLTPAFDPGFSVHSHGFRPQRSAHDAVREAKAYVESGRCWVADIDLKAFFDQVNHDILMREVAQKVSDKRLLKLIGSFLRAGSARAGEPAAARNKGTPQGGPLSPLLANILLDRLDKELEARGLAFVRYADDIAIYARSKRSAERILESVSKWLETNLKVEVNREKSGAGLTEESSLLGFRIHREGRISVAPKALEKLKARVRELWNARQSLTSVQLRDRWREYIEGWWSYFRLAQCRELRDIGKWARRHMRKCFWQRWHSQEGRWKALRKLGVRGRGLNVAASSIGAWRLAASTYVQRALTKEVLNTYGFIIPWELVPSE